MNNVRGFSLLAQYHGLVNGIKRVAKTQK